MTSVQDETSVLTKRRQDVGTYKTKTRRRYLQDEDDHDVERDHHTAALAPARLLVHALAAAVTTHSTAAEAAANQRVEENEEQTNHKADCKTD